MLKLMIVPRTRPGMSRSALHAYLRDVHGPLGMSLAGVGGYFRCYVHHYAVDPPAGAVLGASELARDALTTIAFECEADFHASTASRDYRDFVGPDEANFAVREGSLFHIAEETTLRGGKDTGPTKLFHLRRLAAGVDPDHAHAAWCDRLAGILADERARPILDYVHNRVAAPKADALAYDLIDEIATDDAGLPAWIAHALAAAEDGLFDPAGTAALWTEPRVFRE